MVAKFNNLQIEIVHLIPPSASITTGESVNESIDESSSEVVPKTEFEQSGRVQFTPSWGKKSGWSASEILKEIRLDF